MNFTYFRLLILLLPALLLTGCYTQIATREPDRSYTESYEDNYSEEEDEYYDSYSDTTYSSDENEVEINNYYIGGGSFYRRYFWGYQPGFTIGIGYYSWYDPWCWDPWYYWSGCLVPYPYNPYYYPWASYWHYPYYGYYGYYGHGDGWYWGGSRYRERSRDMLSIRNGGGLRNSYGNRSTLTRTNTRGLNKDTDVRDRERTSVTGRNRSTVTDRDRNSTGNRTGRESIDQTRRNRNNDGNRTIQKDRGRENTRYTTPPKKNNSGRETRKEYTAPPRKNGGREEVKGNTSDRKEVRQRDSGRRESYQPPRTQSPPQRTYSPPSNNSNPPRSTPPSSGGSRGGGNRGSDSGRRSR